VIINNLKHISKKLKPAGILFTTGILKEEKTKAKQALKEYFCIKETVTKAEWAAFYCIKK